MAGQAAGFQMTPLLGVLVGAAATLLLIVIGVATVVHYRQKKKRQRLQGQSQQGVDSTKYESSPAPSGSALTHTSASSVPYGTQPSNGAARRNGDTQQQHHRKATSSSNHSFQKDPDIILTDMGIPHIKSNPIPSLVHQT